ncbi:MAG: ABC transporter substrate-binding protein [Streptosporangiaceae bacterium]
MSRRFRRRSFAGLAALVGLGLLAAGCSGGGSAAPAGLEKTTLNVAAVPAMDSAALYIAVDRGLFAAEGLRVNVLQATSGATVIQSQLKGTLDVTVGNYVSYIRQNAYNPKQDQFRALAAGSIMQAGNQDIMVPSNSRITTVSALAGKKIAVNIRQNIGTLLVSSVLTDNGVQPPTPTSSQFVPIPFPDMAGALASGQVAAAWMPEPYVTEAEENTGAVPLADSNQGHSENMPISGYMVTASWLKKYPNTAAAFRKAIIKAQAIAATDPGAIEQGMVRFASTSKSTAAIANAPEYPTQQNTGLLQRLSNLMLNFGMLPQAYGVGQMIVK